MHRMSSVPQKRISPEEYLRMERAAKLLTATDDKIEVIAATVGYDNPFVFSRTFKKWIGWRPSEYRKRRSG